MFKILILLYFSLTSGGWIIIGGKNEVKKWFQKGLKFPWFNKKLY